MRRRIDTIETLISKEGTPIGEADKQQYIRQHFKQFFETATTNRIGMIQKQWYPTIDLSHLERDFTEIEIKKAIWDFEPDKVPGPDGFPLFFYKIFWEQMKRDITLLISDFSKGQANIERINYSFIVLIPKRESPEAIGDYQSITLLDSCFKIISKFLANRLANIIPNLIDET